MDHSVGGLSLGQGYVASRLVLAFWQRRHYVICDLVQHLMGLKMGGDKTDWSFFTLAIFKEYSVVYLCWSLNQKILAEVVEK